MGERMTDFELTVLREIEGESPISPWGAAVGEAVDFLHENGYIARGKLTSKGIDYLARHPKEPSDA